MGVCGLSEQSGIAAVPRGAFIRQVYEQRRSAIAHGTPASITRRFSALNQRFAFVTPWTPGKGPRLTRSLASDDTVSLSCNPRNPAIPDEVSDPPKQCATGTGAL